MPALFSKKSLEGYLEIDHSDSPGITPEQAARAGQGTIPVGAGKKFQSATINCSHCEALVVLNPLRTRERGYCPKCDKYVCDLCEAERARTGICKPFSQVIDEFMNDAAKQSKFP